MSVTKADIVEEIALQTGLTKIETQAVVEGFLASVRNALAEGKTIEIRGFGSFKVRRRKGRMARNPKTGQAYPVREQFVPYFKVSKEFRAYVDEHLLKVGAHVELDSKESRPSDSSNEPKTASSSGLDVSVRETRPVAKDTSIQTGARVVDKEGGVAESDSLMKGNSLKEGATQK